MVTETYNLSKEEILIYSLGNLYKNHGYKKYSMAKFEPYDMYLEHRNFLSKSGILTFTDATGRLMALRPDVTMSIAKNARPEIKEEKYYYDEFVYRLENGSREVQEIRQMGLEYIGGESLMSEYEVMTLAAESLSIMKKPYIIDIGHMGFTASFLLELGFEGEQQNEIYKALEQKSTHALSAIAEKAKLSKSDTNRLIILRDLAGKFEDVLPKAAKMVCTNSMRNAVEELLKLYKMFKKAGLYDVMRLDFSVNNDIDYYNGIVFRGYIEGVPRYVLAGGRYDRLMEKFDKPQPALGYAMYLTTLKRTLTEEKEKEKEAVLIYGKTDAETVVAVENELRKIYRQVLTLKYKPEDVVSNYCYGISDEGRLEEIQ